jgi:class 3 adenylate cyclase
MENTWDYLSLSSTVDGVVSVVSPVRTRSLPTGVVTFLLADVEGSTQPWEGDEEVMGAAIARHHELLDATIALHGGVRPGGQSEGDSAVGVFARPSDALAAALDAQRAFAEEPWADGRALRVRLALHTGRRSSVAMNVTPDGRSSAVPSCARSPMVGRPCSPASPATWSLVAFLTA